MTTGTFVNDGTVLALLLIGVTMFLEYRNRLRDERAERRKLDGRNRIIDEKEKWRELNELRSKRLEEDMKQQRIAAKEIADGKSKLGGGPFQTLDRFFRESPELRGIGVSSLSDDSLRMIARYVSDCRENYLYPLLESEAALHGAIFDLEFAQALDGPGSVASIKAYIHWLTERMPHLRKEMHGGLRQLRYEMREVSARHRGVPEDQALNDADDARAREPEVYAFMEDLIYRGGYVRVPRNELLY